MRWIVQLKLDSLRSNYAEYFLLSSHSLCIRIHMGVLINSDTLAAAASGSDQSDQRWSQGDAQLQLEAEIQYTQSQNVMSTPQYKLHESMDGCSSTVQVWYLEMMTAAQPPPRNKTAGNS